MVLHDLGLAARYSDRLVVMSSGRLVDEGRPADVLTEEMLHAVFGLRARVLPDPVTGSPLVVPALPVP
jgi:iron complex transport system ATP-binding protein